MKYEVPFIPNTDDDLHCFQSAYLMIVKYFKPEFEMNWDEWSAITGYEEGKATWASAGLLWLKNNRFEVQHVSLFSYTDFVSSGAEYLRREFGNEVGTWQIEHSNISLEQERVELLLHSGITNLAEPTQNNIKKFMQQGYLIRCLVNSATLNNRQGYLGHSIIVTGYDENGFTIHDPGLPALKDRKVSYKDFELAWADPNKEAKELDAIKLVS
jgi:hypothetical protein